ncbi:MAG: hypothetical protein M5U32_13510 [Myxococcota bacterium]|nr:hypothetical protein [Myxococcota bacterium]
MPAGAAGGKRLRSASTIKAAAASTDSASRIDDDVIEKRIVPRGAETEPLAEECTARRILVFDPPCRLLAAFAEAVDRALHTACAGGDDEHPQGAFAGKHGECAVADDHGHPALAERGEHPSHLAQIRLVERPEQRLQPSLDGAQKIGIEIGRELRPEGRVPAISRSVSSPKSP